MRLLVVDDHEIVRLGVKLLLLGNSRWEICGEAGNGWEAIEKVKQLSPDVVLLDLSMPSMNGYEAAIRIRQVAPSTKVIVFSVHEIPTTGRLVGADAFLSKSAGVQELLTVLETVSHNMPAQN